MPKHIAIYISNKENKVQLIKRIIRGELIPELATLKGSVFSEITLNRFIEEENRHGVFDVKTQTNNTLQNSSEGERKRALLNHILAKSNTDYIILDNAFDCLDVNAQHKIKNRLTELSFSTIIIQITTRKRDVLPFIKAVFTLDSGVFIVSKFDDVLPQKSKKYFIDALPKPYVLNPNIPRPLIKLNNVSIKYGDRPILNTINWEINPGEFWQLIGPNGSGKSTILTLISGDNPKGYQQDMWLFGIKKGTGETVWDIKKNIGFYSSEMLRGFKRKDTLESMIISGFLDSIGLYKYPTDRQISIAHQWLKLVKMFHIKDKSFQFLSSGHKRLILLARAMVKHPPLLILDEPINGLDDNDTQMFSELVNKIAEESKTAIIYVSHRKEEHIKPNFIFELIPDENGSIGRINNAF